MVDLRLFLLKLREFILLTGIYVYIYIYIYIYIYVLKNIEIFCIKYIKRVMTTHNMIVKSMPILINQKL